MHRHFVMGPVLLVCLAGISAVTLALPAAPALPDASGPARPKAREWKDVHGQVIKRVAADGRTWLYTYDRQSRLIMVVEGKPGQNGHDGSTFLLDERVHQFEYKGGAKEVSEEIDCRGIHARFEAPRELDRLRGTTLENHHHIPPGNHRTSYEYDDRGNLVSIQTEPVQFTYDNGCTLGRRVNADGSSKSYSYDEVDR